MPNSDASVSNVELVAGKKMGGGRYTLVKLLGQGGMGVVWLAQDERLEQAVALKFLPPQTRADPVALNDLRRETKRSLTLTHPNIIRIHDFFETQNEAPFISMEFVDGQNFNSLRLEQPNQVFAWRSLAPLVKQLCDALDYAHSENVIHRDLKPANMMLDRKGRLKLADFGIASVVSDSMSRISIHHSTSGTLTHMSPQQLDGKSPTISDDIYSLGATLYELITGKPPFFSGEIPYQVRNVAPESVHERLVALGIVNEIPPAVAAMIMACLAKLPTQRPQGARAVADWIGLEVSQKALAEINARDLIPESSPAPRNVSPPVGYGKLLWAIGAPAVFLLALGGWYWATHPGGNYQSLNRVVLNEATDNVQTMPASNVRGSIPPPAGLIHWWPGDGNARDIIGKSDGIMQKKNAFAPGRVGEAFAGIVTIPESKDLNFGSNAKMSVELWVCRTNDTTEFEHIFGKRVECGDSFPCTFQLAKGVNDQLLLFTLSTTKEMTVINAGPGYLPRGWWTHLAVTYNGEMFVLFVNGLQVRHGLGKLGSPNNAPFKIGTSGTCGPFLGLTDEICIYNRALEESEVKAIYNAGSDGKQLPPGYSRNAGAVAPALEKTINAQK